MQEQIRLLIELQKIDNVLGGMKKKREDVPKHLSGLEVALSSLREEFEKEKAELEEMKKDRRAKEGLLQMEIERVRKSEGRLKDIKNQKEYHALLKEIEQGKKLNTSREEDLLRLIGDIEEREKTLTEKGETLRTKEEEYANEKKTLDDELSRIEGEFDGEKRKWEDLSKSIKPNILKLYQRVYERRPDLAVTPARKGACTGCHMNLPPQLYNQIQKGAEMIQCPSCHRILYWEGNNS